MQSHSVFSVAYGPSVGFCLRRGRRAAFAACAFLVGLSSLIACGTHPDASPTAKATPRVHALSPEAGTFPPSAVAVTRCSTFNADKNLYWGDLHTHTIMSADAYAWGNRNFPHDAYRFASDPKAKTAIAAGATPPGPTVSIDRRLDFDAVTDHSEWLGAPWACGDRKDGAPIDPKSPTYSSTACSDYRAQIGPPVGPILTAANAAIANECDGGTERDPSCMQTTHSAWQVEIQAAHDAYQPCTFTTFVAYEWTHATDGATLHQNVVFASEKVPYAPFDSIDYAEPSELWSALEATCKEADGCRVLTIPHNGNLSQGLGYALPVGVDAAKQMNTYQRLTEIHQHKGNSECFAGKTTTDPDCGFEHLVGPYAEDPQNFVRHALGSGLTDYAAQPTTAADGMPVARVNAMQMGIVGATDDHNGLPGSVEEDEWNGHFGYNDDTPKGRLESQPAFNPGGITGVWAEENTRESIFDALYRREVFGTSGPRIAVRFYQVWSAEDYCSAAGAGGSFPHAVIAAGGVPMGGTMLPQSPSSALPPELIVSATKDVEDIAEVDIVKLWALADGGYGQRVHRFTKASPGTVWSGGSVCVSFSDAEFDPTTPTLYYTRVLQTPTWRWSHFDCAKEPTAPGCGAGGALDVKIQERAWSSPIWWLP